MNSTRLARIAAAAACALLAIGTAGAQAPATDTRIISFDQAVEIALEQNDTLRQARNAMALGELDVEQARSDFLPDLRVGSQTSQGFGAQDSNAPRTTSINLSSGVTLFDGFANTASLQGAKFASSASDADLARAAETVVFTVASNFLLLVEQQEQLRVRRENLAAQTALEDQIRIYVNAGARTIADLYQQQANAASARLAVVQAERSSELARIEVIRTLRLDPRGNYEFVAPVITDPQQLTIEPLEVLIGRALETRADIRAGEARLEAFRQDIRVARSTRWPTVSLSAGFGSSFSNDSAAGWTDQLDDERGGSIGLGVSIPIFDRSATRIATRRAELRADNAQIFLDALEQEVGSQVRTAVLDLESARAQLLTARAQRRAAEQALEFTDQRYKAGAATLVELTQSRATQVEAASAAVTALYGVEFRRRLLDYYVGGLTADSMRF